MDRVSALLSTQPVLLLAIFPFCAFVITLGWIAIVLNRKQLSSLVIRGFGLSIQVRASSHPDERSGEPGQARSPEEKRA